MPLHYAAEKGHLDVVRMLIFQYRAKENCEHTPCEDYNGQIDQAGVDCIDIHGKTLLHYASENGHDDVVRILLSEFQANVNCEDNHGQTPLHYVCKTGHNDLVRMLISEFQASAKHTDNYGLTPLHYTKRHRDVIRMLMSEFDVLYYACHIDTVRMLISGCKSFVDYKDNCGQTPLHYACSYNRGYAFS